MISQRAARTHIFSFNGTGSDSSAFIFRFRAVVPSDGDRFAAFIRNNRGIVSCDLELDPTFYKTGRFRYGSPGGAKSEVAAAEVRRLLREELQFLEAVVAAEEKQLAAIRARLDRTLAKPSAGHSPKAPPPGPPQQKHSTFGS